MAHHGAEVGGVHLTAHPVAGDLEVVDAWEIGQAERYGSHLGVDRGPGQVAQLRQRAALHDAAVADDADPVAQGLYLGQ